MTQHTIIGGTGFIGRHVAKRLVAEGADVAVVDAFPFPDGGLPVRTLHQDIAQTTQSGFDAIVGDADVVHHYAWTTIPALANSDPLADLQANLAITIGLLDALKRRGGGRIVFASSGGTVYGRPRILPIPEDHPLEPITAYGVSKVTAEKYMQFYHYLHGIDARVLRISNPYGAGQNPARQQGAVTTFIHQALAGQTIEIWGDGEVIRDFIHIGDLVGAILAAATRPSTQETQMPLYNVGSGSRHSLNDIVGLVEAVLERPIAVVRKTARPFDVPVSVLDVSRIGRDLDWRPRIGLEAGIAQTVSELKENPRRLFAG